METQTTIEGKKADEGKPPIDLVPSELMIEVAKILAFGAKKYGAHNWRAGIKWSRVYAAVQRHLLAWNSGEDDDPESGHTHLAHAACGLAFLLWYRQYRTKFDDRYTSDKAVAVLPPKKEPMTFADFAALPETPGPR